MTPRRVRITLDVETVAELEALRDPEDFLDLIAGKWDVKLEK